MNCTGVSWTLVKVSVSDTESPGSTLDALAVTDSAGESAWAGGASSSRPSTRDRIADRPKRFRCVVCMIPEPRRRPAAQERPRARTGQMTDRRAVAMYASSVGKGAAA